MNPRNFLFLFLLLAAPLSSAFSQTGFVHVQEHTLADGNKKTIKLYGVNLGGWLLWEGWIWGGNFKKESFIKERMEDMFGKEQSDNYIERYRSSFITSADIKAIADLGMNTVRVPINHSLIEKDEAPGVIDEKGFRYLDSVVSWCKRYKIYAVLDLHAAPGGQSPYFISDPDKKNMWKDPENIKRMYTVWKAIAARYKNETCIAGYDLLNEPMPVPRSALLQVYKQLVAEIRTVDTNHLLIIEGANFAKDFSMFREVLDKNQIFSFHFYNWLGGDPVNKLGKQNEFSKVAQLPMWCGEWGEDILTKMTVNHSLLKSPDYNFCGSAVWTWKKVEKDPKRPAINKINETADWQALVKWLNGGGDKPTYDVAKKGMEDFLNAIPFGKNQPNSELYSLLKNK
ncbi:MAG: cellulase family glycosylhydrolase [Bacteroidetes bacterium]|jgi:hypothetical protein|nr:cellulase family glycosylhydrolase [Bacteroidota bacterium]